MKCGICQRNTIAKSAAPPSGDAAVRRGPADQRRQRARHRADQRRERGPPLHRRVDGQVDDERREREAGRQPVRAHGEEHEARERQRDAEDARVARRHAAVRQRAQARPPHQRVGVPLVQLVEHRGAAGDERGAADRLRHRDHVGPARPAKVVARRAGRDDEEIQARLGQRDIVGERAIGARGGYRDRHDVDLRRPSRPHPGGGPTRRGGACSAQRSRVVDGPSKLGPYMRRRRSLRFR